jgi:hypothetical protein
MGKTVMVKSCRSGVAVISVWIQPLTFLVTVHDILDIRKQEEVLGESYMMIPESKARCETSIGDLAALIVSLTMTTIVLLFPSYCIMKMSPDISFFSFALRKNSLLRPV